MRSNRPTLKKGYKLILIVFVMVLAITISYQVLMRTNTYVKSWHELPREVKHQSIGLTCEMLVNNLFKSEIDPTSYHDITKQQLEKSVCMGADWLVSVQERRGRFQYIYDPETKKFSPHNRDNFLRQAGSAFALVQAYEVTRNEAYLKSAKEGIKFQLRYRKFFEDDKSYFLFNKKAKLGGIALPMLTMLKIRSIEHDQAYDKELRKMANMLLYLQEIYGTGQFKSTYVMDGNYNYEEDNQWEGKIYAGEALLALSMMYQEFGDEKYIESFDAALAYYQKHGWWKNSGFSSWAISAASIMFTTTHDQKYAEFAFKMCDRTLRRQNLNNKRLVYGSLNPIPSVFTAVNFEGIGDALGVCQQLGDEQRYTRYKVRSLIAYQWLMSLQYQGIDQNALGGFQKNRYQSEIRIDNVQHAISAMCKGLKYIYFVDQNDTIPVLPN